MTAFNGDIYIKEQIEKFRDEFQIKEAIETGTHQGNSTDELGCIFGKVTSIEINVTYFTNCSKRFINRKDISMIKGNSPDVLIRILKTRIQPILFYLDAHWGNYNPLLDELSAIIYYGFNKSVICIHDFKVPERDFGFDKFPNGKNYEFNEIKESIEKLYGKNGYEYFYNNKASGANRGIIFIYPTRKL